MERPSVGVSPIDSLQAYRLLLARREQANGRDATVMSATTGLGCDTVLCDEADLVIGSPVYPVAASSYERSRAW